MGGFFGVIKTEECTTELFYGIDYNSHMGTKRAGMVTLNEGNYTRSIHNISNSYFRTKFESDLPSFSGKSGIGIISDTDAQPIIVNCHLGKFAIVTVARINNIRELEQELMEKGIHFCEHSNGVTNQTELISMLIAEGKSFAEGIEHAFDKIKGSCSLLILTDKGIIAARDKYGRTPIVVGQKEDAFALSSESCAFQNLGYDTSYFLGPGEIAQFTPYEMTQLRKPGKKMQVCSFLWVYYGYPVCDYDGRNVDQARFHSGMKMGENDDIQADYVSGIPDSGIGMALGYAAGKKIPHQRGIVKYTPTWPRSFTPPSQEMRNLVSKMKLISNKTLIKNKSVVFCDDSIVRGTQLRDHISELHNSGATEVHIRISCPPLIYPCIFLNFTGSESEMDLITRRMIYQHEGDMNKNLLAYSTTNSPQYQQMVESIRKQLNVDTLKFNPLETLIESIGLPKERICTHCFDGSSYE